MAGQYFNVIYNRSDATETEDSKLSLKFVEYLVEKLEGWGYSGYYADRDAIPGRNIFDEMFRVVMETQKTIVVITPEFRSNYWAKYSKQAAFKYLIDQAHQHKLIPIAVNIKENQSLKELNVNEPLHMIGLTEAEWENTRNTSNFNRLKKAFDPPTPQMVVEEEGDNRLRTEVHQQLVTRPTSQISLPYTSSSSTDQSSNVTTPDSQPSIVIYERSIPEPRILSIQEHQNGLHNSNNQLTYLEYDGTTSAVDTDGMNNQSVVEEKAPSRPEQNDRTVGKVKLSSGTNMDGDRIDTASPRNGQNGGMSAYSRLASLSNDRDLSLDVPVTPVDSVGGPSSYLDPRPETLGAEGMSDAGSEMAKLSLGSFEGDDHTGSDDTIPKQVQAPESGQSTPCPSMANQTDDAKVLELDVSGFHSGASPSPSKGSDLSAVSKSKETRTWSNITNSFLMVTKCFQHIDKAYPS